MNKKTKWIVGMLLSVLTIGIVSAGVITYFGAKTTIVTVAQAVTMDNCNEDIEASGGETKTTGQCTATSQTGVDIPIEIVTEIDPGDGGVESINVQYDLLAQGDQGTEDRIRIVASDVGITTLSDLNTITFEQNVTQGYVGHVDVRVIKADGTEDVLVFEYDKVDDGCGNGQPYPTGVMNTFGDKGIVDNSAYAWLSSGSAGNCQGDPNYTVGTLADWKTGIAGINGSSKVVAIEFEVDNWIPSLPIANTKISKLKINNNSAGIITIQAGDEVVFDLIVEFADGTIGTYNLTTKLEVQ